jgi:hypothetical protein
MSESLTPESVAPSDNGKPETSPPVSAADRETLKKLLSEARSTREVLANFRAAIEAGTFPGGKMMDLAKGLSFLDAILLQNQAHIANLQGRN